MLSQMDSHSMRNKRIICLLISLVLVGMFQIQLYTAYGELEVTGVGSSKIEVVDKIEINHFTSYVKEQVTPFLWIEGELWCPINEQTAKWLGFTYQNDSDETIHIKVAQTYEIPIGKSENQRHEEKVYHLEQVNRIISIENNDKNHVHVEKNVKELNGSIIYMPLTSENAMKLGIKVNVNSEKRRFEIDLVEKSLQLTTQSYANELSRYMAKIAEMIDQVGREPVIRTERYAGGEERHIYEESNGIQYEIFNFSAVEKRIGLFSQSSGTGVGAYYFKNGSMYVGEFNKDTFEGYGRYTYENGTHSPITLFKNDQMVSETKSFTELRSTVKGKIPVVILLVSYNDVLMRTDEHVWTQKFFGSQNSLQKYYDQISGHKVKLIPAAESSGISNDGIISIKLSKNHPRGEHNYEDTTVEVIKALEEANKSIDFSKYDQNRDGHVSSKELMVIEIVAGYEGAVSRKKNPIIYAHQGELYESGRVLDGVDVISYVQFAELHYNEEQSPDSKPASLALIAHEVGHLFGIPDLYDTDYSSYGVGPFSLMGTGTMIKAPGKIEGSGVPELDPYSKNYLGWIDTEQVNGSGSYTLYPPNSDKYNAFKVPIDNHQYLLIEYRPLSGNDEILKSVVKGETGGVLIWKVDENVINASEMKNQVNDEDGKEGVELIEATELETGRIELDNTTEWRANPYFRVNERHTFMPQNHKATAPWSDLLPTIEITHMGETAVINIKF